MRILGIDLETTGLDHTNDRITEIAWVIKDTEHAKPLQARTQFIREEHPTPIPDEIVALTGIHPWMLKEHGISLEKCLVELALDVMRFDINYVVAHNGENFDKPFLAKQVQLLVPEITCEMHRILGLPWLDTSQDLPEEAYKTTKKLSFLAAELGFLNPFPHAALFDVATMLKVLEHFPLEKVIERSKMPWVTLRAMVDFKDKDSAKKRRYTWETCGTKTYPKCWVKRVKESEVEKEIKEADFQVAKID